MGISVQMRIITKIIFIQISVINIVCKASFFASDHTGIFYQNKIDANSSSSQQIRGYDSSYFQDLIDEKQGIEWSAQYDRLLQIQTQNKLEGRDQSCYYTCSSCLGDDYYSCTSCFGNRSMKQSINGQISICLCGLGSVDEGPGSCSGSSDQNLEIAIKALFSSAFGVNLLTSFVVWNPMYFLSFNEFSQVISQMAYVNKQSTLNFDQIAYYITNSHLDKILTLQQISDYSLSSSNATTTSTRTLQNPKILLNDKDTSFIVNIIFLIILNTIAWLISVFGKNDVKYHYLFQVSTPIIIYILTFNDLNLFAFFQFSNVTFNTPLSSTSFFFALLALIYIFSFFGYMFYHICLKQVLNEEKQTSQLKQYLLELQSLIARSGAEEKSNEEDQDQENDDVFSKKSHLTNSKPLNQKQNGEKNEQYDAHSMILKDLEQSENHQENKGVSRNSERMQLSQQQKSINILDGQQYISRNLDNESTQIENDSPIKPKKFQLLSDISKHKSSADLIPNNKLDDQKSLDGNLKKIDGQNLQDQNQQEENKLEVRSSIEKELENNKNMQLREEELKLKLIEQEFILQQNRSMFYFLYVFIKQHNFIQRGFFTALIFRKLFFSLINLYIYENPQVQMGLLLLVQILFVIFSFIARPFQMRLHNIFFFFFETIALICFIIFTSIASEDAHIQTQISAIKAICSFLILAYVIFLFIGIAGIVFLIINLIKNPIQNNDEEQQSLKENENKKSHPSDEDDEKNHRKRQELAKKIGDSPDDQSPRQGETLSRNNSPTILQNQQSEGAFSQRGKLIKPFQSVSNVLLEADEEDDDDFNINKKNSNQGGQLTSSQANNGNQEVEMIRRPVQQQLTIIRQQAEELFKQQKQLFERNREKRMIKTMILLNGVDSNRQSLTEIDNQDFKNFNNNNNDVNKSIPDLQQAISENKRKQFDEEMSFNRLPYSVPQTFRNNNEASQFIAKEGGDTTGRRIMEEPSSKDLKPIKIIEENEEIRIHQKKRSIFSPEKSILQNSTIQLQNIGLNSNNNSFYTDAFNYKSGQGMSDLNSPNDLSPIRKSDSPNDQDFSIRFSPILQKRQLEKPLQSKLINLNPSKIDNSENSTVLPPKENPSKITNLRGSEDHLEQKKSFIPGSNSDLYQEEEECSSPLKFAFKFQKSQQKQQQEDQENKNNSNQKDNTIFIKPFNNLDSKFASPKKQINSPLSTLINLQRELQEQNKKNSQVGPDSLPKPNGEKSNNENQAVSKNQDNSQNNENPIIKINPVPTGQSIEEPKLKNNEKEAQQEPNKEIKDQAQIQGQDDSTKNDKNQMEKSSDQQKDEKMLNDLHQKVESINKEKEISSKKQQNSNILNNDPSKEAKRGEEQPLKTNQEEKSSSGGSDDYNNMTHNESYIPYETDLNMYGNQIDQLPMRTKTNKHNRSLILNSFQDKEEKRIRTANVIQQGTLKIEENEQEDDDFNNKLPGPGISFQQK
ncbi:transmembrane protein, putative (macronuclear) [Tetrahymena thermophila SB210]|uniref:Transmembrane protein, putative n=1 Tax=Tetrahymena thermophila (strain SB210) TaxID=312017 RepID=I7M787_TETTS|nr:transmembrane protein, putative [Tetrahymena thermophila SB210]EAR90764.2 transmembrane protein, putative [Tetrahymena thermophila SB210]|eukprot:XP_001011009.2 transmembrane protein, putative [Tetrahymena thermophila SB210]